MNTSMIIGLSLLIIVILTNWKKASFHNIRRYKVTVLFGILDLFVVALAAIFDVQFIGLDVIPWYSYATLISMSVFTLVAISSWMWVHNKITDEAKGE